MAEDLTAFGTSKNILVTDIPNANNSQVEISATASPYIQRGLYNVSTTSAQVLITSPINVTWTQPIEILADDVTFIPRGSVRVKDTTSQVLFSDPLNVHGVAPIEVAARDNRFIPRGLLKVQSAVGQVLTIPTIQTENLQIEVLSLDSTFKPFADLRSRGTTRQILVQYGRVADASNAKLELVALGTLSRPANKFTLEMSAEGTIPRPVNRYTLEVSSEGEVERPVNNMKMEMVALSTIEPPRIQQHVTWIIY